MISFHCWTMLQASVNDWARSYILQLFGEIHSLWSTSFHDWTKQLSISVQLNKVLCCYYSAQYTSLIDFIPWLNNTTSSAGLEICYTAAAIKWSMLCLMTLFHSWINQFGPANMIYFASGHILWSQSREEHFLTTHWWQYLPSFKVTLIKYFS